VQDAAVQCRSRIRSRLQVPILRSAAQHAEDSCSLRGSRHLLEPVGVADSGCFRRLRTPSCTTSVSDLARTGRAGRGSAARHLLLGTRRQCLDARGDRLSILPGKLAEDPVGEASSIPPAPSAGSAPGLAGGEVPFHQQDQEDPPAPGDRSRCLRRGTRPMRGGHDRRVLGHRGGRSWDLLDEGLAIGRRRFGSAPRCSRRPGE